MCLYQKNARLRRYNIYFIGRTTMPNCKKTALKIKDYQWYCLSGLTVLAFKGEI